MAGLSFEHPKRSQLIFALMALGSGLLLTACFGDCPLAEPPDSPSAVDPTSFDSTVIRCEDSRVSDVPFFVWIPDDPLPVDFESLEAAVSARRSAGLDAFIAISGRGVGRFSSETCLPNAEGNLILVAILRAESHERMNALLATIDADETWRFPTLVAFTSNVCEAQAAQHDLATSGHALPRSTWLASGNELLGHERT